MLDLTWLLQDLIRVSASETWAVELSSSVNWAPALALGGSFYATLWSAELSHIASDSGLTLDWA